MCDSPVRKLRETYKTSVARVVGITSWTSSFRGGGVTELLAAPHSLSLMLWSDSFPKDFSARWLQSPSWPRNLGIGGPAVIHRRASGGEGASGDDEWVGGDHGGVDGGPTDLPRPPPLAVGRRELSPPKAANACHMEWLGGARPPCRDVMRSGL